MTQQPRPDDIFNDALEVDPGLRGSFVARVCGGDADLRRRVEVLLRAHDRAGDFLLPSRLGGDPPAPATADPTTHLSLLRSGTVLSERYRIESHLGGGGMGEVWRAYDLKLRVEIALKALRPELFANERARELLRREVRSAREVISPNVCRVFDLVIEQDQELVSMEYVDGRTLLELLTEEGPLDPADARDLASQLLAGLEAIHSAGLVHRDMKPENVMITRTGRVVVMDFGIARGLAEGRGTMVAGTPAYMAPEQARGEEVDQRADIFAAGILLAEMIATKGTRDREGREALFAQIRRNPPQLPESAWAPVLHRAVAWSADDRYPSARALARALEEVTLRVADADDRSPYPGLASFTESDAEYFFGREAEVEELWKKLQRLHLLAVIGPSGVGKSSFLRAGVLAAAPGDWKCLVCAPGTSPFTSVAQALVPEFAGDADAIHQLLNLSDPHAAGRVFGQWRGRHGHVLLVVDQFEELFTLNPESVQEQFTTFLRALAVDHDVHVLLSMRDDFLFRCHAMPALSPIFSDLTPMGPLTGAALRRALVQPALGCGYRFEDEALVDEMMQALQSERGALPLLAFAAARLWERRNRQTGVLERESYREIGGVGGALAQHAESTLERIGSERAPVVREIFRNLVTSQNTRAVQSVEELLSVFEDRAEAEGVLRELIAARLLTSFEAPGSEGEEGEGSRRVELIHESLLTAWPRLVRWQSQDADSARLRDQLRQAAQLWQERGKLQDLLWTGTAYQEFELWREHYPGGLTHTEEAFAKAMHARVAAQRRRRRIAVGSSFTILLIVLAVVGTLWQRSAQMNRRSEARRLQMLAEQSWQNNNTKALALAVASLEREDNPEVRSLALAALWRGPLIFQPPAPEGTRPGDVMRFSPDGKWLASLDANGSVLLWPSDGGPVVALPTLPDATPTHVEFSPDGTKLTCSVQASPHTVYVWSFPERDLVDSWQFDTPTKGYLRGDGSTLLTASQEEGVSLIDGYRPIWRRWPVQGGPATLLGQANSTRAGQRDFDVSTDGKWLVDWRDRQVYLFPLDDLESGSPVHVGSHEADISGVGISADGKLVASGDKKGTIRIWTLDPPGLFREYHNANNFDLVFDPQNDRLMGSFGIAEIWDLNGPAAARPLQAAPYKNYTVDGQFDPSGNWLAVPHWLGQGAWLYPVTRRYPYRLKPRQVWQEPFVPILSADGREMILQPERNGVLAICDLESPDLRQQVVFRNPVGKSIGCAAFDHAGDGILVGCFIGGLWLVPRQGAAPRELPGTEGPIIAAAFSPSDRRVAASAGGFGAPYRVYLWDLGTGERRVLDESESPDLHFLSERTLVLTGEQGLRIMDIDADRITVVSEGPHQDLAVSNQFLASGGPERITLYDRQSFATRVLPFRDPGAVSCLAIAPDESFVVAGYSFSGDILVHHLDQERPHELLGQGDAWSLHVDPTGEWITAAGIQELRIWPVPRGRPLLHRPLREFLAVAKAQTNMAAVMDPDAEEGFRLEPVYWNGWESTPTW